jgi:ATP-dependent RNA helicase DeaD
LAQTILIEPVFITITKSEMTNSKIEQSFYVVDEHERDDALIRLYDFKNPEKSIIFCRTKKEVDRLSTFLVSLGYSAKGLHGDMEQRQREEAINAFKKGKLEVLIATDVAARGLDVNDVSHVFNYHLPFDSESYVHRIGRTGRAGKEGKAISIVTPHEFRMIQKIQQTTGGKLEAKVIPNIKSVKEKKVTSFIQRIRDQEVHESVFLLLDDLKEEFDISTIAFKLASMLAENTAVQGNNFIGKSQNDIERLFERMKNSRDDGRSDSRGRGRGNFSRNRNKSGGSSNGGGNGGGGYNRNRSSNSESRSSASNSSGASRGRRRD